MKRLVMLVSVLALVWGCAPYKLLKPKKSLTPQEGGYLELKKDEKAPFKLAKNKKYYIVFPAAEHEHFYLVLDLPQKKSMNSFLTDVYKKKTIGAKIGDESPAPDTQSVYPIGKNPAGYFWFIENGPQECELNVQYRYTPQWRFKFENKHAEYAQSLAGNRVDRTIYTTLGASYHFGDFSFPGAINEVTTKSAKLDKVNQQLLALEKIFPPTVINSTDKAYLDFKELKKNLEDEMLFQNNYLAVLNLFAVESMTRGNTGGFIDKLSEFASFYAKKLDIPEGVTRESHDVLGKRVSEIAPFYRGLLKTKDDARPFDEISYHKSGLPFLDSLVNLGGIAIDPDTRGVVRYLHDFEKAAIAIGAIKKGLADVSAKIAATTDLPGAGFFDSPVRYAQAYRSQVPAAIDNSYGDLADLRCSRRLNNLIEKWRTTTTQQLADYQTAQGLLGQLIALQQQRAFRDMLGIIRQYPGIAFLSQLYRPLDDLSLNEQVVGVRGALEEYNWPQAERRLSELHFDQNWINPAAIYSRKYAAVGELEDSLVNRINRVSRSRVLKFLEENVDSIENVDSMYTDSVWVPAYVLTFTSGDRSQLAQRNTDLAAYLTNLKENEFPEKAIKLLYDQFVKNPDDNGVLKARAIVAHGEHYKGDDKTTKRRAAEVNPWASKWITVPTEYRRVFVVPITSNKRGKNRYFFRINIRIPTDAKFPVYDVNIKLPKEIARNAATEQWYEKMTLNKKLLKNEGRFTISAPTPENNYECQITPMRVRADKSNVLDVYFWDDSYKVHTVSVMVQKPLIKKN